MKKLYVSWLNVTTFKETKFGRAIKTVTTILC